MICCKYVSGFNDKISLKSVEIHKNIEEYCKLNKIDSLDIVEQKFRASGLPIYLLSNKQVNESIKFKVNHVQKKFSCVILITQNILIYQQQLIIYMHESIEKNLLALADTGFN